MSSDPPEAIIVRVDKSIAVMDERILFIYNKMDSHCDKLSGHDERIDSLEETRDKQFGACAAVGFLAAWILAVMAWMVERA